MLGEYTRIVVDLTGRMSENIKQDIISDMTTLPLTNNGIDMDGAGYSAGTTTWTYAIEESVSQFSALNRFSKHIREKVSGEDGIITKIYRKKRGY